MTNAINRNSSEVISKPATEFKLRFHRPTVWRDAPQLDVSGSRKSYDNATPL